MSWFDAWFGGEGAAVPIADIVVDGVVSRLSISQNAPGQSAVASAVVQSLSIGHRFHRARLRVRIKSGAIVQSLSLGETASSGPGKTPTP